MKLSVVIPAYNEAGYIGRCLESLQSQTRPADEIIVVDNNCRDDTVAIARHYPVTIISERRQGIWAAASAGYDNASGDIIVRCDADCILPPDWLARIETAFNDSSVVAMTGPGQFYGAPRIVCRLADVFYMKAYFVTVGAALGRPPLFGSNFALRTNDWHHIRQTIHEREDIHDDIDLSYHLPISSHVVYDPLLSVQISARPLFSPRGMFRRYGKGMRSIMIHWPEQAPWQRYVTKATKKPDQ